MGRKILLRVLIFAALYSLTSAQCGTCHQNLTLVAGQSVSVSHTMSQGPCCYHAFAPTDHLISVSCSATLVTSLTCNDRQLVVSRSGEWDLRDRRIFCTSGTVAETSIGNELIVAYQTNYLYAGSFNCKFTAIAQTNANCDCGWNVATRIVGGTTSGVNEFVSHVGLVDTGIAKVFCGGVIVSQRFAVTAAHCVDAAPIISKNALLAGDHDISTGTDTKWSMVYAVHSFIKHPTYNSNTNKDDIALVKTVKDIRFNPAVGPGCLPYIYNGVSFDGNPLIVAGWGTIEFSGPTSNILRKTQLTGILNTVCSVTMPNIDQTKICTDGKRVNDSCQMDSGGGVYYRNTFNARYYSIAVINYGNGCAGRDPSVNSRFDKYFSFIETHAATFFCRK